MITERTLKKWRMEALAQDEDPPLVHEVLKTLSERILRLTQELLDQHLLRKVRR